MAKATGGHGVYIHVQKHRSVFEQVVLRAVLIVSLFFLLRSKEFLRIVVLFYEVKNGYD